MREIRYLLDTSVYSQRLKKNPNENVIRWWKDQGDGRSLGDMDLFIASTALHHQLQLATLNVKHFAGIPGLRLVEFG